MPTTKKIFTMLENENLWETATKCHALLTDADIAHAICGGVAVCIHGYQRNTVDLDIVVQPKQSKKVKQMFQDSGMTWNDNLREFRTDSGIAIQFLISGEPAGSDSEVRIPNPAEETNVEIIEGLSVLRLSKLIEMKLACGSGNMRRMHKDFADVVELIAIRRLNTSFTRYLHRSLQPTFRQLMKNANS